MSAECLPSVYHTGDLVLRGSLLFGNSLGVGIERDAAGRMPEQLLNNLDVSAARAQERWAGVAERVPSDFLRDADSPRNVPDLIAHNRLPPSTAYGLC